MAWSTRPLVCIGQWVGQSKSVAELVQGFLDVIEHQIHTKFPGTSRASQAAAGSSARTRDDDRALDGTGRRYRRCRRRQPSSGANSPLAAATRELTEPYRIWGAVVVEVVLTDHLWRSGVLRSQPRHRRRRHQVPPILNGEGRSGWPRRTQVDVAPESRPGDRSRPPPRMSATSAPCAVSMRRLTKPAHHLGRRDAVGASQCGGQPAGQLTRVTPPSGDLRGGLVAWSPLLGLRGRSTVTAASAGSGSMLCSASTVAAVSRGNSAEIGGVTGIRPVGLGPPTAQHTMRPRSSRG